ncbi:MAG: hypothetical protein V7K97_23065 [Nostoc sp.]|uniref:hypothetical protein n=1 Tax=Nostoc sp. TaxID=1180 RepID=UPI002FFA8B5E
MSIEITSKFWLAQAFKDNVKAQALVAACMQEALQRRCDSAFQITKTEQQYEQQSIVNRETWEQSREYCKDIHFGLMPYRLHKSLNSAMVLISSSDRVNIK